MPLSFDPNKTIAILVGVSDYDTIADFPNIKPILGNIEDFSSVLINKIKIPKEKIEKIINKTNYDIDLKINEFIVNSDIEIETLIFYYAGHGFRESKHKNLYILGRNSAKKAPTSFISFNRIKEIIEGSHIPTRIVFIDACHSGLATMDSGEKFTDAELKFESIADLENENKNSGTYILASSAGDQKSYYESDAKHTIFTNALLDILEKGIKINQEYLLLDSIYKGIQDNLKKINKPEPVYKSNLKDPIFFLIENALYVEYKNSNEYLTLIKEGDNFNKDKYYKDAMYKYQLAYSIKSTEELNSKITSCQENINHLIELGIPILIHSPSKKSGKETEYLKLLEKVYEDHIVEEWEREELVELRRELQINF